MKRDESPFQWSGPISTSHGSNLKKKARGPTAKRIRAATRQLMSSKFSTGLNLLVLLLVSQSGIERVWAHAYPVVSLPLDGAVLKEPREVRIQFTEGLELAFRQIVVKGLTARSSVRENCASWRMIQWRS